MSSSPSTPFNDKSMSSFTGEGTYKHAIRTPALDESAFPRRNNYLSKDSVKWQIKKALYQEEAMKEIVYLPWKEEDKATTVYVMSDHMTDSDISVKTYEYEFATPDDAKIAIDVLKNASERAGKSADNISAIKTDSSNPSKVIVTGKFAYFLRDEMKRPSIQREAIVDLLNKNLESVSQQWGCLFALGSFIGKPQQYDGIESQRNR